MPAHPPVTAAAESVDGVPDDATANVDPTRPTDLPGTPCLPTEEKAGERTSVTATDGEAQKPGSPSTQDEVVHQVEGARTGLTYFSKTLPEGVAWQWQHRDFWEDYRLSTQCKIEEAYHDGQAKVRFKSGKSGQVPMEIFFADMVQFDPVTENQREVRRLGPDGRARRLLRTAKAFARSMETGSAFQETFDQFSQRRHLLRQMQSGHISAQASFVGKRKMPSPYHETSCAARVARSNTFFVCSMLAVLLNSIWIGVEVDLNKADDESAHWVFRTVENIFCALFVLELAVRCAGFKAWRSCLQDSWFRFDLIIAICVVAETWIFQPLKVNGFVVLRLMRLARLSRVTRLLQVVPEAVTLLKGIAQAARSVIVALIMLLLLTYTFAIFFTKQARLDEDFAVQFGSVGRSWLTLWYHGVILDDVADVLYVLEKDSLMVIFFIVFILLSNWTVLNMLVGILCDVVSTVKKNEDECKETKEIHEALYGILECYDGDGDQTISKEEFDLLMLNPEVDDILAKFGTDKEGLKILTDITFSGESQRSKAGYLTFREVIQGVLRMRGEHTVQVTDITELSKYLRQRVDGLEISLEHRQAEMTSQLTEGQSAIKERLSLLSREQEMRGVVAPAAQVPRELATLKLKLAGIDRPKMVRHAVSTSIGELLEQLSEQHGPLRALDAEGIMLGNELTICDLLPSNPASVVTSVLELWLAPPE